MSTVAVSAVALSLVAAPVAAVPDDGGTNAATASKAAVTQGDLVKLSQRVREVIRVVEKSEVPCDIRNTVVRRLRLLDDALLSGRRTGAGALLTAWKARADKMAEAGLLNATTSEAVQQRLSSIQGEIGLGMPKKPKPTRNWPKLPDCSGASAGTTATGTEGPPAGATATGTEAPAAGPTATGSKAPAAGATATSSTDTWNSDDTLTVLTTALYMIPSPLGSLGAGMLTLMWPTSTAPDVTTIVDQEILKTALAVAQQDIYTVKSDLETDFQPTLDAWLAQCPDATPGCGTPLVLDQLREKWGKYQTRLHDLASAMQLNAGDVDYRVELLPLYVQIENLYLSHLQLGVVNRAAWWPGEADLQQIPVNQLKLETETQPGDPPKLGQPPDPNVPDLTGVGYVEDVYKLGTVTEKPVRRDSRGRYNIEDWTVQNTWARDTGTIQALYFSDIWPFMDPTLYPSGNPGYKQTRMIYTDPMGCEDVEDAYWDGYNGDYYGAPIAPPNPSGVGKLALLEIYVDNNVNYLDVVGQPNDMAVIDAITAYRNGQTTASSPMGDPTPEEPLSAVQLGTTYPRKPSIYKVGVGEGVFTGVPGADDGAFLQRLAFFFGDGTDVTFGSWMDLWGVSKINIRDWTYDNQILTAVNILDTMYQWQFARYSDGTGQTSADCAVFGFRFADSF